MVGNGSVHFALCGGVVCMCRTTTPLLCVCMDFGLGLGTVCAVEREAVWLLGRQGLVLLSQKDGL